MAKLETVSRENHSVTYSLEAPDEKLYAVRHSGGMVYVWAETLREARRFVEVQGYRVDAAGRVVAVSA